MFAERDLDPAVAAVRDEHAPDAVVLDADSDFETLPAAARDDLATRADALRPHERDADWLPADAPALLVRLVDTPFVVGAPGDGSVAWTTQTDPATVVVKPRVEGSPEPFVAFLVAEALVEVGRGLPEHFLDFFGPEYPAFADALDAGPATAYQVAAACLTGYRGLHTREVFRGWADDHSALHDAWRDAGDRLRGRLADLPGAVARGDTEFGDAAELALGGVRHDCDLPAPFAALNGVAFREYGPEFAVQWADRL